MISVAAEEIALACIGTARCDISKRTLESSVVLGSPSITATGAMAVCAAAPLAVVMVAVADTSLPARAAARSAASCSAFA